VDRTWQKQRSGSSIGIAESAVAGTPRLYDRLGTGSHRNFRHPSGVRVTLSGRPGDDAKRYQEQEVAQRMAAARSAKGDKT
jgi:hypothetical protein